MVRLILAAFVSTVGAGAVGIDAPETLASLAAEAPKAPARAAPKGKAPA